MTLKYYNFSTWIIASKIHNDDDLKEQTDKTLQSYKISF